jgi:hypothetical protein
MNESRVYLVSSYTLLVLTILFLFSFGAYAAGPESQLADELADIRGLQIYSYAGSVILDGNLIFSRDLFRIHQAENRLRSAIRIRDLTTLSRITMNLLADRVQREIGLPEISTRALSHTLFLEGSPSSRADSERALAVARSYFPQAIVTRGRGQGRHVAAHAVPTIVDLTRPQTGFRVSRMTFGDWARHHYQRYITPEIFHRRLFA